MPKLSVEERSELFALLFELSLRAEYLLVLGLGKRPFIRDGQGWARWDLGNWKIGRPEGFGGREESDDEDDEEEDDELWEAKVKARQGAREEEAKLSKTEIIRDRWVALLHSILTA